MVNREKWYEIKINKGIPKTFFIDIQVMFKSNTIKIDIGKGKEKTEEYREIRC